VSKVPVILFGDHIAAYGVLRALGPENVPIHIVSHEGNGLCARSRYVTSTLSLDPKDQMFLSKLMTWLSRRIGSEAVLMVAGEDDYLDTLSQNYESLGPNLRPTFPSWDTVRRVREKRETYEIAERIGIPVPRTFYVTSEEELRERLKKGLDAHYPLLMKCEDSKAFLGRYGTKGVVANDETQLFESYVRYDRFLGKLLLQEMIPGGENQLLNFIGIYNRNAEPIQVFMNRKVRSSAQFLSCTLMETMWSGEVLEYSNRLIKEIGYWGYANPEYKYDARDGKIKLMEVNGRISMSNSHAFRCGLDVIGTLYRDALEGPLPRQETFEKNYPDDILWWLPAGDLATAARMFREGSLTVRQYVRSVLGKKRISEPINWRDPRPFVAMSASVLRTMVVRLWNRKRDDGLYSVQKGREDVCQSMRS